MSEKRSRRVQELRGIAIALVLLFHLWQEMFPLGYLGVDLFFLISGYLIGPWPNFPDVDEFFGNRSIFQSKPTLRKSFRKNEMPQEVFRDDLFYKNHLSGNRSSYISTVGIFCQRNRCNRWSQGWLYSDDNHLSYLGTEYLEPVLSRKLLKSNKG